VIETSALDDALDRSRLRRRLPAPDLRRHLRERAGISQADVARALGVARPTISRWEAGARSPRGSDLLRYVDLLDRLMAER